MKILHIITGLRIGGAEYALFNLLQTIRSHMDFEHRVLCFYDGPVAEKIRNLGIDVMLIRGIVRGYDPVGIYTLYKIVKSYKPDIIHTALWAANMVGRLLGYLCKIPVINELHGNVVHEGFIRNWCERRSWRAASYIVAVSNSVYTVYDRLFLENMRSKDRVAWRNRLVTIDNGIDRDALVAHVYGQDPLQRSAWGLSPQDFVIGAIGRLEKIKSFDVLIRALRLFIDDLPEADRQHIRICLVGDGSERASLQALVKELSLEDHVIFVGWRLDASRFYALFDCFALSSQSEGLSLALLEAVALGIPVISTHSGNQHDALVDDVNGFLVSPNDCVRYAHALKRLYSRDIVRSSNYEPLASFSFDITKTTKTYRNLYKILEKASRG